MKPHTMIAIALFTVVATGLQLGCEEEDLGICELLCDADEECQYQSAQMFSYSQCHDECTENLERHQSIGCGDRLVEFYECLIDIPCSSWGNYGERCAAEIDYLDSCVGGNS